MVDSSLHDMYLASFLHNKYVKKNHAADGIFTCVMLVMVRTYKALFTR